MWNPVLILVLCFCTSLTNAVPLGIKQKNMAIVQQEEDPMMMMATDEETRPEVMISRLNLPSNATSIRADITDGFSCDNKTYGYYADVENECQIFHVCLPVTYADGKENTFRWSFICPEETVFSQDSFTCMRPEDMSIDCEESFKYYELNRNFGVVESEDSPSVIDEESNVEGEYRSQEVEEEDRKQVVEAAPVKKQTVKVQSSNRRKTQTNRVAIDSQRRKVQPLRKLPQAVVPAPTTAKPVEEDAPILEQEVERTTVKYQRFTKRPTTVFKEQPKPEPIKPEQQLIRTDLFAQKRKRPQIFSSPKVEAAVQTEAAESQKTEVAVEQKQDVIAQDEAEAQASEIAAVSIKPQVKKEKPESVLKKEPAFVYIPVQEEIAPIPENTPTRAEIVEIPIQKVDEPIVAEAPALPAEDLQLEKETEKLLNEELIAEQSIQAELTKAIEQEQNKETEKVAEPEKILEVVKNLESLETPAEEEKPVEAEKVILEPIPEIYQMLEAVKAVENLSTLSEVPASEPENEAFVKSELIATEPEIPVKSSVPEIPLEIEAEVPFPLTVSETEIPAAVPELPLESEVSEPEILLKAETSIPESVKPVETVLVPEIPLTVESAAPEMPLVMEAPAQQVPLVVELPVSVPETPLRVEAPVIGTEPEPIKLEAEVPTIEATKTIEILPPPVETPIEVVEKLAELEKPAEIEIPAEPLVVLSPEPGLPVEAELPVESHVSLVAQPQIPVELELEKSSEIQAESAEQIAAQPEQTVEEANLSSAAETEDTQSLILDFISSLVNSENENSNLEEQAKPIDEVQSESVPEPAVAVTDEKPSEIPAVQEQPIPMYIPTEQGNDKIYQIPVEVIETPEPQPEFMLKSVSQSVPESVPALESESVPASEPASPVLLPVVTETKLKSVPQSVPESVPALETESVAASEPASPVLLPVVTETKLKSVSQSVPESVPALETESVAASEPASPVLLPAVIEPKLPLSIDDVVELVKESLDTPAEKENLIQEPLAVQPPAQSDSDEVKPIYHRYFEFGSNLLKSEALTASDEDEPTVVAAADNDSTAQEEVPKAIEHLSEPEKLASVPESAENSIQQAAVALPEAELSPSTDERLPMSRSLNRFRMDPRKRRFLFRSDAS